tara:strand:+ start:1181 stop:1855 length:675 start_codon:yes stop_codon:yes gene_type:complete
MNDYESIVELVRENPKNELELRFGKKINNKFCSGVSYDLFQEIHNDLMTVEGVTKTERWYETMDVFFDHQNKEMRTRVTYSSEKMEIEKETIIKKRLSSLLAKCNSDEYDFRISVSSEETVKPENLPAIVDPKHVRLKHSKSFFILKKDINVWRIDLSKCWSSDSRTSVEEKQHTENPIYEVECELVDTDTYLKTNDNSHILKSIIMKGLGLAGTPKSNYTLYK